MYQQPSPPPVYERQTKQPEFSQTTMVGIILILFIIVILIIFLVYNMKKENVVEEEEEPETQSVDVEDYNNLKENYDTLKLQNTNLKEYCEKLSKEKMELEETPELETVSEPVKKEKKKHDISKLMKRVKQNN